MTTDDLWRRSDGDALHALRAVGRPIRVLEIANGLSLALGGSTANAIELHAALNRRPDVSSHLISARRDGDSAAATTEQPPGAPMPKAGGSRIGRVLGLLTSCDVLVLHGYYVWWVPIVAPLGRLLGRSVLVIPHGSLTRHQRRFSRGRKRVWELGPGPLLRTSIDAFVVGSEVEAVELAERFPRARVLVGGAGTNLPAVPDRVGPEPGDGRTSPVRLLSLSRIAPKKRIDLMIDAVAELRRRGVSAQLTVAGEGDAGLKQQLLEQAERQDVTDLVDFVGMLEGIAKEQAYGRAQYFLAPSDDENFGISPAEALARAVPLIASEQVASASGLPSRAGALLESPSGATIADAVQRLLGEDQAALRSAARAFAEQRFDWNTVAATWADLLFAVRGRRTMPPRG